MPEITEQDGGYGLVVSFSGLYSTDAEERAFVHGVEFGRLWHRMRSGQEAEMEETVHTVNRGVIERAAASQGWDVEFRDSGEPSWLFMILRKTKPERRNPHGLRAVK